MVAGSIPMSARDLSARSRGGFDQHARLRIRKDLDPRLLEERGRYAVAGDEPAREGPVVDAPASARRALAFEKGMRAAGIERIRKQDPAPRTNASVTSSPAHDMTRPPLISAGSRGTGSPPAVSGQRGTRSNAASSCARQSRRWWPPRYVHGSPIRQALMASFGFGGTAAP